MYVYTETEENCDTRSSAKSLAKEIILPFVETQSLFFSRAVPLFLSCLSMYIAT